MSDEDLVRREQQAMVNAYMRWARIGERANRAFELLQEIVTEGYMGELIARKVVSGLRCQEEQECFGKIQELLKEIDRDK